MAWYDFLKRMKSARSGAQIQRRQHAQQQRAKARRNVHTSGESSGNNLSGTITPPETSSVPVPRIKPAPPFTTNTFEVRRHFYNETGFQTYGSFFAHWDGWITAGHVITEAKDLCPPFAHGEMQTWPGGLDACAIGCTLPAIAPEPPRAGQAIIIQGFPAGARHIEERKGLVYFERSPGTWIAHIQAPDEPVVTGMSGGAVLDAASGEPIGILITRNSPADLNSDRDPDESADFVALCDVWHALAAPDLIA